MQFLWSRLYAPSTLSSCIAPSKSDQTPKGEVGTAVASEHCTLFGRRCGLDSILDYYSFKRKIGKVVRVIK